MLEEYFCELPAFPLSKRIMARLNPFTTNKDFTNAEEKSTSFTS